MNDRNSSHGGFTLAETLIALAIMCMVILLIAMSAYAIFRVYDVSVFDYESGTLISTAEKAIEDVLRYACDIRTDADGNVTAFTNAEHGIINGALYCEDGLIRCTTDASSDPLLLVAADACGGMTLSDLTLKYDAYGKIFTYCFTVNSADGKYSEMTDTINLMTYRG